MSTRVIRNLEDVKSTLSTIPELSADSFAFNEWENQNNEI
jgi:hypothetical protein